MRYKQSFLNKINRIIDTNIGFDADIRFSVVSEKRFKKETKDAENDDFIKVLFSSKSFLIMYTRVDEDVDCFINKENQTHSVQFATDENLIENKIIQQQNKVLFVIETMIPMLKSEFPEIDKHSELQLLATAQCNWNIPIDALKFSSFNGKTLKDELLRIYRNERIYRSLTDLKIMFKNIAGDGIIVNGVGHFFTLIN